jgi:uncharacterized protein YijF (DUF1287 family)
VQSLTKSDVVRDTLPVPARRGATSRRRPPQKTAHSRSPKRRTAIPSGQPVHYGADDLIPFALVFLPFVIVATAVGASHSLRRAPNIGSILAEPAAYSPQTTAWARRVVANFPRSDAQQSPSPEVMAPAPPPTTTEPAVAATAKVAAPTAPIVARAQAPLRQLPLQHGWYERVAGNGAIRQCVASSPDSNALPAPTATPVLAGSDPRSFGLHLAAAARAQVASFVVYNDKYRTISYPMGDVPAFYGVCTDVIVRAYRALGIDLQPLVHEARVGAGDPSIDHRRTEVLRRFFAANGVSLPVTSFVEDYRPGDIVTYHRPDSRSAQSHIAIVADDLAPSGRPMIVHNRGWGPKLEDALFADRITGHYRYSGSTRPALGAKTDSAKLQSTKSSFNVANATSLKATDRAKTRPLPPISASPSQ